MIEPVITQPLRRRWQQVQDDLKPALDKYDAEPNRKKREVLGAPIRIAVEGFRDYLGQQRVLDPACGSGNFLYVALQQLLNLEDEAVRFAARRDISLDPTPRVRPTQLHGIEINPYAAELAQVVIWIGYLQWLHVHGIEDNKRPILDKLQTIEHRDAILDLTDKKHPKAAHWDVAEFIVGNPPFLGSKVFRQHGLKDDYLKPLWKAYDLPRSVDLCCYWFDRAIQIVKSNPKTRCGLLATQAIRAGENRDVLNRIKTSGDIFAAWSDREWILDGADVRVSIVAFDGGQETDKKLDGKTVDTINADLSTATDITQAKGLAENSGLAFMGVTLGGPFDIDWHEARSAVTEPNPSGESNSTVLKPIVNASEVTRRPTGRFAVDFGADRDLVQASMFETPLRIVEARVKPDRINNRRESYAKNWWRYVEARPALRRATAYLNSVLVTPRVAKHRTFTRLPANTLADSRLFIFAFETDFAFGVLQSSVHELWSLATCSWHGVGNDPTYNTGSCFETFPLPWPPGKEDVKHPAYVRIAAAAKALDEQRERWLNPPEWIEPLAAKVDAADDFADVPADARPLIRRSAIMAAAAKDARLKKRTLTNLYNERPTWLKLAHDQLDRAVLAAYASVDPGGGWQEDWAEVWVDTGAGQPLPTDHPLRDKRAEIDQRVLAELLRLNHARAGGS